MMNKLTHALKKCVFISARTNTMNMTEYQKQVQRTMPKNLTGEKAVAMLAMGIAGEAGEIVELLKKSLFHDHDITNGDVAEEIGDLLWYLANLATKLKIDLGRAAQKNIEKLKKRYPDGFDTEKSKKRADKEEDEDEIAEKCKFFLTYAMLGAIEGKKISEEECDSLYKKYKDKEAQEKKEGN